MLPAGQTPSRRIVGGDSAVEVTKKKMTQNEEQQQAVRKKQRLIQIFLAKLVLEVMGGGGAIWGPAEVVTWRKNDISENLTFWQRTAKIFVTMFAIRFFLQLVDQAAGVDYNEKTRLRMVQIFMAKLVLEVCGAAGAIWGFFECVTLRNERTQEFWRFVALSTGTLFLIRYVMQIADYMQEINGREPSTIHISPRLRFVQIFSAKLVLEVFGAAGAVWGFSDFMTWRNSETQETWRFNALVVGLIFFVRYGLQMRDYYNSELVTLPRQPYKPTATLQFSLPPTHRLAGTPDTTGSDESCRSDASPDYGSTSEELSPLRQAIAFDVA